MTIKQKLRQDTIRLFTEAGKLEEFRAERWLDLEVYLVSYAHINSIYYGVCLDFDVEPTQEMIDFADKEED